jgi:hypothetical protein
MFQYWMTAALLLLSLHASADSTVYRCNSGGKISYGSVPCVGGTQLGQSVAESTGPATAGSIQQQKALADQLERERHQREAQELRERKQAAARRLHCDKLRLHKKWRDEDAASTGASASASARAKMQRAARRSAEELALSCPS